MQHIINIFINQGISFDDKLVIKYNRSNVDSGFTSEEYRDSAAKHWCTNAVTLDDQLVNIDGVNNRVTAMCVGADKVYVLCGINKIVADEKVARKRVGDVASSMNAQRLKKQCLAQLLDIVMTVMYSAHGYY